MRWDAGRHNSRLEHPSIIIKLDKFIHVHVLHDCLFDFNVQLHDALNFNIIPELLNPIPNLQLPTLA